MVPGSPTTVPIVDLGGDDETVAASIDAACRAHGFFVITGHDVDATLFDRLESASRRFFALDVADKEPIAMRHGGRAWRGWFPPGGELTSGVPDGKEGIYFGAELGDDHPAVRARRPLHGANLFPDAVPELEPAVLDVLDALTALGHRLLRLVAIGLGLDPDWFETTMTRDPTILFRIFHYPPAGAVADATWGVQEHTDYGLLTILRQDDVGGLQVRDPHDDTRWIDATPIADSFVCNIGDMLERMTGGTYRSTPHRVRRPDRSRLSFPFFFDPSWEADIVPVPGLGDTGAPSPARWDGRSVFDFEGSYGDYLTAKVAKVFPDLWAALPPTDQAGSNGA